MNTKIKVTRHDIPQTVKDVINVAVHNQTIDIFDVYELANEHGQDWVMLVNDLCQIAHSNRHWNADAHRDIVAAAEAYWAETPIEELRRSW